MGGGSAFLSDWITTHCSALMMLPSWPQPYSLEQVRAVGIAAAPATLATPAPAAWTPARWVAVVLGFKTVKVSDRISSLTGSAC